MGLNDLPTIGLIRSRMGWLSSRHAVIADNIAHAAKPGFVPHDLAPFGPAASRLQLTPTAAGGLQAASSPVGLNTVSRGGPVSLEQEAASLSETSMDYQVAATLYARSFRLIKTALGKR